MAITLPKKESLSTVYSLQSTIEKADVNVYNEIKKETEKEEIERTETQTVTTIGK